MNTLFRILLPPVATFVFFGSIGLMIRFLSPGWALLGGATVVALAVSLIVELEP